MGRKPQEYRGNAYYEAHRHTPRGRLGVNMSVESQELVKLRAEELGLTISQYVRYCIEKECGFKIFTPTEIEENIEAKRVEQEHVAEEAPTNNCIPKQRAPEFCAQDTRSEGR